MKEIKDEVFTTSYISEGLTCLLTCLTMSVNPDISVELGTQQGSSAIMIAKGLRPGQKLITIDLFEEKYRLPPHGNTHAKMEIAIKNIHDAGLDSFVEVREGDALESYKNFDNVDLLHIDLCNHADNVYNILVKWVDKVRKMILIEGGNYNYWQKKIGFESFNKVLLMSFVKDNFNYCTIVGKHDHSLTILTRKINLES